MPRVPSPAAAHIGRQIAEARKRYSYTQDQLAAATGIDSSNIRGYESGRAMVSVHTLVRIAEALAVTPGDLLDGLTVDLFDKGTTSERRAG